MTTRAAEIERAARALLDSIPPYATDEVRGDESWQIHNSHLRALREAIGAKGEGEADEGRGA